MLPVLRVCITDVPLCPCHIFTRAHLLPPGWQHAPCIIAYMPCHTVYCRSCSHACARAFVFHSIGPANCPAGRNAWSRGSSLAAPVPLYSCTVCQQQMHVAASYFAEGCPVLFHVRIRPKHAILPEAEHAPHHQHQPVPVARAHVQTNVGDVVTLGVLYVTRVAVTTRFGEHKRTTCQ